MGFCQCCPTRLLPWGHQLVQMARHIYVNEAGPMASWEVKPQVSVGSSEGNQHWTQPSDHSNKTSPRSSRKPNQYIEVEITRAHDQILTTDFLATKSTHKKAPKDVELVNSFSGYFISFLSLQGYCALNTWQQFTWEKRNCLSQSKSSCKVLGCFLFFSWKSWSLKSEV